MPVIFGCTLILIFLIRYETQKHNAKKNETINDFLLREMEANTTRKKDISNLPYLTADMTLLPDPPACDPEGEFAATYDTLRALDQKQMLNLSDTSNTDLKLAYGVANFPFLSECDTTYTAFTRGLQRLATLFSEAGDPESAICVLEYALRLHTDIGASYRLLGTLYADKQDSDALLRLKETALTLPELIRTPVLQTLDHLLAAFEHSKENA